MPETRIVYTLGEIKALLARIHRTSSVNVEILDDSKLSYELYPFGDIEVTDDSYLFVVTK